MKMVFLVRSDLKMGKGKIAAQVAHAAVELYKKADRRKIKEWEKEGAKKVVLKVKDEKELLEYYRKAPFDKVLIRDSGLTEVPPGSITVAGFGPEEEKKLDILFKNLKLL